MTPFHNPPDRGNSILTQRDPETFDPWGPAVVSVFLHILFVIDGRINTTDKPEAFGLKFVLDTLRDPSFSPSVRLLVDVVRRDNWEDVGNLGTDPVTRAEDIFYTVPFSNGQMQFKFTDPKFNIDAYDQIWFFGDYPANSTLPIDSEVDKNFYSLRDANELKLLADWMDRGGGVFAAGDHWNLGASMCSRIPRVRTMRKWTLDQLVPPQYGYLRNETLQGPPMLPIPDYDPREGDTTPQSIEPVYRARATSILDRALVPHALLIAPDGAVINRFPDHMHEGEVIEDLAVELHKPLDISGYNKPEYPSRPPEVLENGGTVANTVELPSLGPRPHVVAHARTTLEVPLPGFEVAQGPGSTGTQVESVASPVTSEKRFGLISAYDGQAVGIGRVVVESTWHHWFSYNLHGFRDGNPLVYQHMQAYYRNVALWLATAAQRQSILVSTIWAAVALDTVGFPEDSGQKSLWSIGKKAVGSVQATLPSGILFDCVASFFDGREEEIFGVPAAVDPSEPFTGCLPTDLAVRAIVGGIASALLPPTKCYLKTSGNERRHVDPDAIARHALEGAHRGKAALVEAVRSSATVSGKLADLVEGTFRPLPVKIQIERIPLRIVADRLQLPDPTDPALADGHLTLTIRLSIGGAIVESEVLEDIDVSSPQPGGIFVALDRVLYEGFVQEREHLVLEIFTGASSREPVSSERLRFEETLDGKPSTWIGRHIPSVTQAWRLWYRIEPSDIPRRTF
jgi:hypothetical protein